jgi:uncharacterized protein YdeI (YjbR/CyaY-like superfamily)
VADEDLPLLHFEDAAAFDAWLQEHPGSPGIYLRIAKKNGAVRTVSYADAVQVALRHGWIDSQARRHDDDSYKQRFTPRRKRSPWSQINRAHAERLIAEGRMHPSGLAQVEAAKADGRWDKAYASPSKAVEPPDLTTALEVQPSAQAAYAAFNQQNRFSVIQRLSQLEGDRRRKWIDELVAKIADGWKPYP